MAMSQQQAGPETVTPWRVKLSLRTPDHLGDGVMAMPAVAALARIAEVHIHAPRWGSELYGWIGSPVLGRDEAPRHPHGVLFKPSFGAAWRWRHLSQSTGFASHFRGPLLTTAILEPYGHRRLGYDAIARHFGAAPAPFPKYPLRGTPTPLPPRTIALNPWSPSATVRWPFYRDLAQQLVQRGHPVVFFCGPNEQQQVKHIAQGFLLIAAQSLPDFAATLQNCALFISNDSGAAHFAAACDIPVLMIHGSTSASLTGVGTPIDGPSRWCKPCYRKSCPFKLACLTTLPAHQVLAEVVARLG